MNLLVAGADRVDAGKTTFSVGLLAETGAVGFKPRAGNDHWFDHDDVLAAVTDGRLYGKDARRLADAAAADVTPERINPVHRLWTPTPGRGAGVLGRNERRVVVDRVRTPDGDRFLVNGDVEVPAPVREGLALDDAPRVADLGRFNDAMARLHAPALERVGERVADADRAVVESYADIARPLQGMEADAVAVVEPRRCRVFDGERYLKACEVASGSAREGRLEEKVPNVLELLEPSATVTLPPLSSDELGDPGVVADAYGDAYDAVLATAFG
jgi:predicted P-loop ATPase/GTPase